jgi:hypothetical protein
MEATRFTETSVFTTTTQRYIPEDGILHFPNDISQRLYRHRGTTNEPCGTRPLQCYRLPLNYLTLFHDLLFHVHCKADRKFMSDHGLNLSHSVVRTQKELVIH